MMPLLISVAGLSSCPLAPEKERSRSQISTSAFVLLHDYYYYCFLSFFFFLLSGLGLVVCFYGLRNGYSITILSGRNLEVPIPDTHEHRKLHWMYPLMLWIDSYGKVNILVPAMTFPASFAAVLQRQWRLVDWISSHCSYMWFCFPVHVKLHTLTERLKYAIISI